MLDRLTAADFEPPRESAFQAAIPGAEEVAVDVVSLTRLPAPPATLATTGRRLREEPFEVVFRARTPRRYTQGIITLKHDRFGPLDIFVVPIGQEAEGLLLQAVFA